MTKLVLASGSPRRRDLLRQIGITDFEIRVSQAEETYPPGLSPAQIVEHLSRKKAEAVPCGPDEILITADTLVFLGDQHLGKPADEAQALEMLSADEAQALEMLSALQGRQHTVCTGVTLRRGEEYLTEHEATAVCFRPAAREELLAYIATGEPMDKAGGYGIQGRGALLVERLEGDYFNVMGLPLLRLARMLRRFGIDLFT